MTEDKEDKTVTSEGSEKTEEGGDITSPEGILMLCVAGVIDIISLIPGINIISDILGVIIIGGWLVITRPGQAFRKVAIKFLIVLGIELIPIVSIAPSWTWLVYSSLKK
jgi:hypothetical protein